MGLYSTSFLKMHVHTEEDLTDLKKVSELTEATYLHEYIHFLQDITTTYGFMNISTVVDYIRLVNQTAVTKGQKEFEVPFQPKSSDNNNVKANWELKEIYLGGGRGINDVRIILKICKCIKIVESNTGNKSVEYLVIEFEDSYKKLYKYTIGAYCISESMAYTIEQFIYPGVLPPANRMPYESVKIICDFLYPDFGNDPLNIIALCDACLMFFNPGPMLYDTLQEMIKQKFSPKIPEDIYEFVYENAKFNFNGHTTINQLLISSGAEAIYQLSGYFTTEMFLENRHWVNYIVSTGMNIRMEAPTFILDFVRNGKIKKNFLFAGLLHKLGSPFVVNDLFQLTFTPPTGTNFNIAPEYFWVINQNYKIFKGGKVTAGTYKCEMIKWCQDSCKNHKVDDRTDERCRNAPWERANDADPNFCAFGKVWKTWGMKDEIPKSKIE